MSAWNNDYMKSVRTTMLKGQHRVVINVSKKKK